MTDWEELRRQAETQNYQKFYQLKEPALLDEKTLNLMATPRNGVPDIDENQVNTARFVAQKHIHNMNQDEPSRNVTMLIMGVSIFLILLIMINLVFCYKVHRNKKRQNKVNGIKRMTQSLTLNEKQIDVDNEDELAPLNE